MVEYLGTSSNSSINSWIDQQTLVVPMPEPTVWVHNEFVYSNRTEIRWEGRERAWYSRKHFIVARNWFQLPLTGFLIRFTYSSGSLLALEFTTSVSITVSWSLSNTLLNFVTFLVFGGDQISQAYWPSRQ